MQPWQKINLTQDQLQVIYREWGIYYTHQKHLDIAADYYDISLNLKNDPKAFYNRSVCYRHIAEAGAALKDSLEAVASDPLSQPYNLEVCDAMYQRNNLEEAITNVYNRSRKFTGLKLKAFRNRSDIINDNFKASLGKTMGQHILENEEYFYKAFDLKMNEMIDDKRPLWKILKEQQQCDVLSVLDKEEELIHPREVARRNLAFKNFFQMYMRKGWIDLLFMKSLRNNPSLLIPQFQWSSPQIKEITNSKFEAAMRFLKMLHVRSPLYTQKTRKTGNRNLAKELKEKRLFRIQYQVHRNMLNILKQLKFYWKTQQIEKLTQYIESVMGDYVILKTRRIMPWKFEFMNEVYDILALAHIDNYLDTPKSVDEDDDDYDIDPYERLRTLLKIPIEKQKENRIFSFGDKSSFQDPDLADLPIKRHRKFLNRMDKRMMFSRHSKEKSYILHEIARSHLNNSRYDEGCVVARKAADEAKKCNSLVWNLLGLLLICKSHALLHRVERIQEVLLEAEEVAKRLEDEKLIEFIDSLTVCNLEGVSDKRNLMKYKQSVYTTSRGSKVDSEL